jgi:hypothetical protein
VGDIERLENVQRRAVGMVSGLASKIYEERCAELGIQTLENRRRDQDMAQVFRYSAGVGGIRADVMFEAAAARDGPVTRQTGDGSNFKIPAARLDIRKNSFAVRTVQHWNRLPPEIKAARNCDTFKRDLKKWRKNGGRPT